VNEIKQKCFKIWKQKFLETFYAARILSFPGNFQTLGGLKPRRLPALYAYVYDNKEADSTYCLTRHWAVARMIGTGRLTPNSFLRPT